MNRPRYSKAALKTTLQLCAASVIACVLLVGFMSSRRTAAQHRYELAEQNIQSARARLQQANDHRALIEKYQDRYQQLVDEGLTVHFDRAVAGDWFEAALPAAELGAINSYVIGKSIDYTGPETAELSAYRVIAHRLDFTATVAHEDEFADLMSALEQRVPGTTAQEACSLTRNHGSSVGEKPLLAIGCALIWYEFTTDRSDLTANSTGN